MSDEESGRKKAGFGRGSFTVEASFVVPMLLGIIFVILYLLFLFHDRIVVQENGCRALYSMAEGTLRADNQMMRQEVGESLWIVQIKKATASAGTRKKGRTVKGKVVAEVRWDIPVMALFMNDLQEIHWSQEVSCIHPEEVVRWKKK